MSLWCQLYGTSLHLPWKVEEDMEEVETVVLNGGDTKMTWHGDAQGDMQSGFSLVSPRNSSFLTTAKPNFREGKKRVEREEKADMN